jgi:excisionase family DNA binding protein
MTQLRSVEEAARILSISPWTVRFYARQRKLLPVRIGRCLRFEESELQRFIDESRTKPPLPEDVTEHKL